MRRAVIRHPAGTWPEAEEVATVTLAFDDRFRRRIRLADDGGTPFLLDLTEAALLGDGDGLELESGGYVRVRSADEDVLDVCGRDPAHMARLAWHLGNRHTPVQVLADGGLRVRYDHVLAGMLQGLGAAVTRRCAPFAPETGAYAGGHGHRHRGHSHDRC